MKQKQQLIRILMAAALFGHRFIPSPAGDCPTARFSCSIWCDRMGHCMESTPQYPKGSGF